MGRLQDKLYSLKYGTEQKMNAALQVPLSLAARNLQKKLKNEDPEKVKGFLTELSEDMTMPPAVREGCKQLLAGMETNTPLDKAVSADRLTELNRGVAGDDKI